MKKITITIFGSSVPKPGDLEYSDAYFIAKKLAQNGFDICSGGSSGIMDAVSKAATEEGRNAIGVTLEMFKWNVTKYLTEEIKCETLFQRLDNLVTCGDGFIILPGGTGTLLELSLVWELLNKDILDHKPIACLGKMWRPIIDEMENRIKKEGRKENLIKCFDDPDQLVKFMKNYFSI